MLGLASACSQKSNDDVNVSEFAGLVADSAIVVLDVRSAEEFTESHIERAINIDVRQINFVEITKSTIPRDKMLAIYCRTGRRSANACAKLKAEGYRCVNLKGGITAWKEEGMPVTK